MLQCSGLAALRSSSTLRSRAIRRPTLDLVPERGELREEDGSKQALKHLRAGQARWKRGGELVGAASSVRGAPCSSVHQQEQCAPAAAADCAGAQFCHFPVAPASTPHPACLLAQLLPLSIHTKGLWGRWSNIDVIKSDDGNGGFAQQQPTPKISRKPEQ